MAGLLEVRVIELLSSQLGQFILICCLIRASFDNIRAFIIVQFASQDVQPETNPSFADSSPVPVDLGPRQTQTDPSVPSPCIDCESGSEAQEPVQVGWATSSFLAPLRAAGIAVPQGVVIGDRVVRVHSLGSVHAVPAQHEQPQEPLGGGKTMMAAPSCPAPELEVQGGQAQSILRSQGLACAGWPCESFAGSLTP